MGVGHFWESWINRADTPRAYKVREAFETFLKRMTGWEKLTCLLSNSGAEANEVALGLCYARRANSLADKILAFEGSFHGRTLVSLGCTWSKQKREPFQWPEVSTVFCSYPGINKRGGEVLLPIPQDWHRIWAESPAKTFVAPVMGEMRSWPARLPR